MPGAELIGLLLLEAAHSSVNTVLKSKVMGLWVYQVLWSLGHRYGPMLGLAGRRCPLLVVAAASGRCVGGPVEILLE